MFLVSSVVQGSVVRIRCSGLEKVDCELLSAMSGGALVVVPIVCVEIRFQFEVQSSVWRRSVAGYCRRCLVARWTWYRCVACSSCDTFEVARQSSLFVSEAFCTSDPIG